MTFSAEVRATADQAVVKLTGDLNALAREPFEAASDRALAGPPEELVLDFSDVSFVNSTGIALLVDLLGRARSARILVVGRGLDDHHRHIFDITRLSDFMRLEDGGDTDRTGTRQAASEQPAPEQGAREQSTSDHRTSVQRTRGNHG